jgi:hypothetical protein
LVRHTDEVLLLVPANPLRSRQPDEHFAAEAAAARDAGITVALIDLDALADPGGAQRGWRASRTPAARRVYRGWMMSSASYAGLAVALTARGARLRTDPAQYQRAHELPGWHPALAEVTPQAAWTDDDAQAGFRAACERLGPGPAVLCDYVKSMKHHWHEAAYIPDAADAPAAWKVAARFRELRDDEFTGGFVLRRFEHFDSAEART